MLPVTGFHKYVESCAISTVQNNSVAIARTLQTLHFYIHESSACVKIRNSFMANRHFFLIKICSLNRMTKLRSYEQ